MSLSRQGRECLIVCINRLRSVAHLHKKRTHLHNENKAISTTTTNTPPQREQSNIHNDHKHTSTTRTKQHPQRPQTHLYNGVGRATFLASRHARRQIHVTPEQALAGPARGSNRQLLLYPNVARLFATHADAERFAFIFDKYLWQRGDAFLLR